MYHTDTPYQKHKTGIRIQRWGALTLWLCGVTLGYGQSADHDFRVQEQALDANRVAPIVVSPDHVTTLLFPRPIAAVVGYGMTSDPAGEDGWIQYAHPADSGMLTLRVLKSDLKAAYMTVLVGDDLYNFELANDPERAALSVKLVDRQVREEAPAKEVTPKQVRDARPVYDPEKLHTLLRLAADGPVMRQSAPDLYQGYECREVANVSDYGEVVATVKEIHRFPVDDAVVLSGDVQNKGAKAISFNPAAVTVAAGDREYPAAFVDCAGTVNPGQTIKFGLVAQGDLDGGRAHLAARNNFRVLLPDFRSNGGEDARKEPAMPKASVKRKPGRRPHRQLASPQASSPPKAAAQPRWQWPWRRGRRDDNPQAKAN